MITKPNKCESLQKMESFRNHVLPSLIYESTHCNVMMTLRKGFRRMSVLVNFFIGLFTSLVCLSI